MDPSPPTRRNFLQSSAAALGGGWLLYSLPALSTLAACARESASRGEPLTTLTPDEGRTMAALAARIIPSEEGPGAEEAGAVHFVDRAVGSLFPDFLDGVRDGLADLDTRATRAGAGASSFADLEPGEQDGLIRDIENTPFFQTARMLTIMAVFSDPSYGGNRDGVGWTILGMERADHWSPPFGYYDAELARDEGGAP